GPAGLSRAPAAGAAGTPAEAPGRGKGKRGTCDATRSTGAITRCTAVATRGIGVRQRVTRDAMQRMPNATLGDGDAHRGTSFLRAGTTTERRNRAPVLRCNTISL